MPTRLRQSGHRPSRREHAQLAFVLRLLALVLGLQLSSLGAIAPSVFFPGDHDCCASCDDCPLGREGRECPPRCLACIACHCAHGGAAGNALARHFEEPLPLRVDAGLALDPNTALETGPRAASSAGVYRPPRS